MVEHSAVNRRVASSNLARGANSFVIQWVANIFRKFRPCVPYKGPTNMPTSSSHQEWKKGSAELLVLSLLEDQPRHGYDISNLIQLRSGGALRFHVTSLYPLLHRLEQQGSIQGRWVEKSDQRRRRYYSLTPQGRAVLRSKKKNWKDFVATISRITGIEHA